MTAWLEDRDFKVYSIPETATLMMKAGVHLVETEFTKQVKL